MIQLYSKKLNIFADLGDVSITFNLQNPYQHFFEEPEEFSYSFDVPITENNSLIFNEVDDIEVVAENYVILQRFTSKIISKSLTQMTVSLYKTRIVEKAMGYSTNYFMYSEWDIGRLTYERGALQNDPRKTPLEFYPLGEGSSYEVDCYIVPYDSLKSVVFTGLLTRSDEIYNGWSKAFSGIGSHKTKIPHRFFELKVPYRAFLSFLLGYEADKNLYSDDEYIGIPIDAYKFRLNGKIHIDFKGGPGNAMRPSGIWYEPKHSINKCLFWDYYSFPYEPGADPKQIFNYFPFSVDRDKIQFDNGILDEGKSSYIYVENSMFPVYHIESINEGDKIEFINNAGTSEKCSLEFDVDQDISLLSIIKGANDKNFWNGFYYLGLDVGAIINQYYEDFAKELPILCSKNKIPETLFTDITRFDVYPEEIISWKEEKILEEDWNIKRFGYDEFWAPYQGNRKVGSDVKLRCTDVNLFFHYEYNFRELDGTITHKESDWELPLEFGLTAFNDPTNTHFVIDEEHVYLHPIRKYKTGKPISESTIYFFKNYVQSDTNKVEMEITNYDFSSNIVLIGDNGSKRYFRVDSVETSDFKIFKLILIEYYE